MIKNPHLQDVQPSVVIERGGDTVSRDVRAGWREALDELKSLPREERLARIDIEKASDAINQVMEREPMQDVLPITDFQTPVLRVVEGYREFCREYKSEKIEEKNGGANYASESQDVEVFELSGSIKWFDSSKGYGFIVPDANIPDVLLHVTCLRAGGYETAFEGARVHFLAMRRPKGMQAFRILGMDNSTAISSSDIPQRTHVIIKPGVDWERAVVKWFNRVRGFGFLTRGEGTPDIFIDMETLGRWGFSELRPGQIVQVRWGHGNKGCMATEIRSDASAAKN